MKKKSGNSDESVPPTDNSFRSPNSDVEVPKSRNRRSKLAMESTDSLAVKLDPLAVTKQNMSTSRRPAGTHKNKV